MILIYTGTSSTINQLLLQHLLLRLLIKKHLVGVLGVELAYTGWLFARVGSHVALESGEEIVQQDALAWLHLSPLASVVFSRIFRLARPTAPITESQSATSRVGLLGCASLLAQLIICAARRPASRINMRRFQTILASGAFRGEICGGSRTSNARSGASFFGFWRQICGMVFVSGRATGLFGTAPTTHDRLSALTRILLLNQGLLMLNDLLELFFAELV